MVITMNSRGLSLLAFALFALTTGAHAQINGAVRNSGNDDNIKLPAYDIVSIKINTAAPPSWNANTGSNHYEATNVTLKTLIENAYDIKEDLISGIPGSVESLHFDVTAKLLDDTIKPTDRQLLRMMIPVLAERFKLQAHIEIKTLPVYDLSVIHNSSKLKPSEVQGKNSGDLQWNNSDDRVELHAKTFPIGGLADALAEHLHRTVIDKTGLTANYDFTLRFTDDSTTQPPTDDAPNLYTALEDQLGLKLQSSRGPVRTLVVDHVEPPTSN